MTRGPTKHAPSDAAAIVIHQRKTHRALADSPSARAYFMNRIGQGGLGRWRGGWPGCAGWGQQGWLTKERRPQEACRSRSWFPGIRATLYIERGLDRGSICAG